MKNCEPTLSGDSSPGHRDRAALVRLRHRLVLDRVARAAAARPGRVAALDHERGPVTERRRPVERRAVVEAARRRERRSCRPRSGDRSASILRPSGPSAWSGHGPRLARREAQAGWSGSVRGGRRGPAPDRAGASRSTTRSPRTITTTIARRCTPRPRPTGPGRRRPASARAGAADRRPTLHLRRATTLAAARLRHGRLAMGRCAWRVMRRPPGRRDSRSPRRGGPHRG